MNVPATHYAPSKRTLAQVQKFLAKCEKNGSAKSAARLMANHGNLEADAMKYVQEYAR